MEILSYINANPPGPDPGPGHHRGHCQTYIEVIPDKFIPLILLVFGIGGALAIMGPTVDAVIQGVLVAGAAVYGNQLVKQMGKE